MRIFNEFSEIFKIFTEKKLITSVNKDHRLLIWSERQFGILNTRAKKLSSLFFRFYVFPWSNYCLNFKIAEYNSEIVEQSANCCANILVQLTYKNAPASKNIQSPFQLSLEALKVAFCFVSFALALTLL